MFLFFKTVNFHPCRFPRTKGTCAFLASERIEKLSELNSFELIKTRSDLTIIDEVKVSRVRV